MPANAALTDGQPIEIGVKFRADVSGFITGIRFYKGAANTGTHVGHLWSSTGTLLAVATFSGETTSGWQQVDLSPAVAIAANTTYVASYHADSGFFAFDNAFFAATGVDAPPLHALQAGVDGANGVFLYGASGFPTSGGSNNYWIDVVFQTDLGPDVTPPSVLSVDPPSNASGAALASAVRATFSEALDDSTMNSSTFTVRSGGGAQLAGAVSFDPATRVATFATTAGLLPQTTYTATLKGGAGGILDRSGNALATDVIWSFTTGNGSPAPDVGPDGSMLVLVSSSNPFGRYYSEILRTEGLNEFRATDISAMTPTLLAAHDIVLLAEMPLTAAQVSMLADYVSAGGNLIAMRPDKQLAALLGLVDAGGVLANAYLRIDTSAPPGAGLTADTMQFHGAADRYTATTATVVATLFGDAATATANPAVTIASVGAGHAAAFTFDLARSIVYTRQGNPAWSGQERDGIAPVRSDDLFFGAAPGDNQPDWIDLAKAAIPQADEQQRLLANVAGSLNRLRTPLPRFWYLPRALKAAIVMTGDDHGNGGTVGRFTQFKNLSAAGCSVADWQCIRSTSYIYNGTPGMDDAASTAFVADGFEVALHVSSNCANWTPSSLASFYSTQLAQFRIERPGVPSPQTNRTHCIAWSDYVTQAKVELASGIRFDTNYYFYPPNWVQDRPGLFTGSAMPMRFADVDGTPLDVYQAVTQMTDESGQTYPFTADKLLDRALGPLGYYGVFTANHHTDQPTEQPSDATVASAIARGVPVVSAKQMLDWLDGRNASTFSTIVATAGSLSFAIAVDPRANGLTAMVPTQARGPLTTIARDGVPIAFTAAVIKGVEYAIFPAVAGNYLATYMVDTTPPVISGVTVTPSIDNTAVAQWTTDEPADSRVDFGTTPTTLDGHAIDGAAVTTHSLVLAGLAPRTTYSYQVTSRDAAGNAAVTPLATFTTPGTIVSMTDTTVADFSAGTSDGQAHVSATGDGEVTLRPTSGAEFFGDVLPADWSATAWNAGGTTVVSGGLLSVDGSRAGTIATFGAGRSLEFVATFGGASFQHVGFGDTFDAAPWAIFSTLSGGALFARTNSGSASLDTALPASLVGSPHRFRIDWTSTGVTYSVDGAIVASHAIPIATVMRPLASDFSVGGGGIAIDWIRMSPYAPATTFMSRVFDGGSARDWGTLSWSADVPAGTAAAFFVRLGDTPTPDASWTAFAAITASGSAIGGRSRYAQYRVDLSTTDATATPSIQQVVIGSSEPPTANTPVGVGDTYATNEDVAVTVAAPGILGNDSDPLGRALTAVLVAAPQHGTLTKFSANGSFRYKPSANFNGVDSFTYRAVAGSDGSADTVVTLQVASVDDAPVAVGDIYRNDEGQTLTIGAPGVLANDYDVDGDPLSAVLVTRTIHGKLTFRSDGSFIYVPNATFDGSDSFTYRASANGKRSPVSTVIITGLTSHPGFVAQPDSYAMQAGTTLSIEAPGVLVNDLDPDGESLTADLVTMPTHGALTLHADGSFVYIPAAGFVGTDSFIYRAMDEVGAFTAPTIVTIAVQ